jgi:hypothetical protein
MMSTIPPASGVDKATLAGMQCALPRAEWSLMAAWSTCHAWSPRFFLSSLRHLVVSVSRTKQHSLFHFGLSYGPHARQTQFYRIALYPFGVTVASLPLQRYVLHVAFPR